MYPDTKPLRAEAPMSTTLRSLICKNIKDSGALTVAEFMSLALYHPVHGYYARAPKRTGRTGDYFTSVDVGPQFGRLLAKQLDEMCQLLGSGSTRNFELVEVGASNGQLALDILDAATSLYPQLYEAIKLTLVEASPSARAIQRETLGKHQELLVRQLETLPDKICGVILANELLDALPTHAVTMTTDGLREVFIGLDGKRFVERIGPPSTPELARYLKRLDITPETGWRGEINLAAIDWIRSASQRLQRGFIILIDYGHQATELYSGHLNAGTLTTFHRHLVSVHGIDPQQLDDPEWLACPGQQDITSHVDLTSVRNAALAEGLDELGFMDQTKFLLGLGALDMTNVGLSEPDALRHRLAIKTLLVPGGLGSTHQVLLLGKQVGSPPLIGSSLSKAGIWKDHKNHANPLLT